MDMQMLHLGRMTWSELGRGEAPVKGQVGSGKSGPLEIPSCRGHSLVSRSPAFLTVILWWIPLYVHGQYPIPGSILATISSILAIYCSGLMISFELLADKSQWGNDGSWSFSNMMYVMV